MNPFDNMWFAMGVPVGAVTLALIAYGVAAVGSRRLDREYGQR